MYCHHNFHLLVMVLSPLPKGGAWATLTFFNQVLIVETVENRCIECPVGKQNTRQHGQFVPLRF